MPAADEVWRLQNRDDADCVFFRRAVLGHERPSSTSLQGIYVIAPGGALLGGLNALAAEPVIAMLEAALAKWNELAPAQRRLPSDAAIEARHRWEDSYPESGLVLVRTARDLPAALDPAATPVQPFNRDQVWFLSSEARALLPDTIEVGAEREIPRPLFERIARFHLVDAVRGQTLPFAPSEISGSLRTRITRVEDGIATVCIHGETRGAALGAWLLGENDWTPDRAWPRGLRTAVYGSGTFDVEQGVFTRLDVIALGVRWGRTENNGRGHLGEQRPGNIGFSFRIAPPTLRVAPAFIDVYDAPWVKQR